MTRRTARTKKLRGVDRRWMKAFGWGLVDPTKRPFDEWIDFIFNHPVTDPEWYVLEEFDPGWAGNPGRFLGYTTKLFQHPAHLLNRYSPKQIDQGFRCLLSPYGLARWIWERKINIAPRVECVLAMANVFEQIFEKRTHSESCYMWWDYLRNAEKNNPDPRIKEAMLAALSRILKMSSGNCQVSALHGLSHLNHPKREQVIRNFLKSNVNIDAKTREYAKAAMKGKVL